MVLRKLVLDSIKIRERTLDVINETGVVTTVEIPDNFVEKASEIFVEGMGVIFADVVFDITKDKTILKGFYQEV